MLRSLQNNCATMSLLFCLMAAFPTAASAQPDTVAARVIKVEAGTYVVETSRTHVAFGFPSGREIQNLGEFAGTTGTLVLDTAHPSESRLDVSIPTAGLSTYNDTLDKMLKGPDWFDATQFPTIAFQSTRITVTKPGRADVEGNLSLHGVTRPVILTVRFKAHGADPEREIYTAGFQASGKIKRSDYGVRAMLPFISDEINLTINATFAKHGK